jgi:enterochelin esterase-like enzyme
LNPNRLGPVSYIELPAAKPKAALVNASASLAKGKVESTRFHSDVLANDRDVWVYTPPGYSVDYAEFNGNHSYVSWRADFADRLTALLGNRR